MLRKLTTTAINQPLFLFLTLALFIGGGIYAFSTLLTLQNCTISNNHAANSYGGGVYSLGGTIVVKDSTIAGNTALHGGGVGIFGGGSLSIQRSTITGNHADGIQIVVHLAQKQVTLQAVGQYPGRGKIMLHHGNTISKID